MAAFNKAGKFRSWKALVWLTKQSKETSSNYTKWTTIPPSYYLHTGSSTDTTVLQQQEPLKASLLVCYISICNILLELIIIGLFPQVFSSFSSC